MHGTLKPGKFKTIIYLNYIFNIYYLEVRIIRSSGNSNPFISICNRNAEPSAQTPITY